MESWWFEQFSAVGIWITKTLNSGFGTALAGAFFGAVAASYFARRHEHTQQLLQRLHASNAATSFSIATLQHALGFKDQLAKPLVDAFNGDKARYVEFLVDAKAGKIPGKQFEVEYNFGNIKLFRHNANEIERLVVREAGAEQKVIMAATFLVQTLNSLQQAIEQRDVELQRLIPLKKELSDDQFAQAYFGVTDATGNVDERYCNCMSTLEVQLDSTIFYAKLIAENLGKANSKLAKKIGRTSPKPITFTFDHSAAGHLLPDDSEFPDWV